MRPMSKVLFALNAFFMGQIIALSTFMPVRPPAIPLAVSSPYLNVLQFAGNSGDTKGYLAGQWPQFWAGQTLGWAGMIRVDNTAYTWMGVPGPQLVTQTSFEYTSTKSIFTMNAADKIELRVTFLSPVTPDNIERQSLIFSYLNVEVTSLDGNPHDVQLYADISAEWVAGDHSSVAQWEFGSTDDGISYHKVYRQTQLLFSETADQADWGNWYWSTKNRNGLTHQSGSDKIVRGAFINNGNLDNTEDTNFRPINRDFPVFGHSINLGAVTDSQSVLFTIGLAQDQAMQFASATGIVSLPSLWTSFFPSETSAVSSFYNDFEEASTTAENLDNKISTDSIAAGGQDYLTITSLSTRQAFASTQLVGSQSKQYLFLKEISSDGNIQTVDVIYPFYPIIMYLQPSLAKLMLDPLFENQESGQYPKTSSMHDLGSHFPNATGHADGLDEPQPLEECGNMLIMTLAYAQRTNDVQYLAQHYNILKQWTGFLVQEALIPADQISTDDFAGSLANQTNLALKGIIGIQAMSVIAEMTGQGADAASYGATAKDYLNRWQTLGVAHDAIPPHTTLSYGQNDSHGLLYNLYANSLLNFDFVPQSIYDMQSAFYPTVKKQFGVPLDTRHAYTKSDWEMWTAAISSDETKALFISDLAKWLGATPTNVGFTDLYDTETGDFAINVTHFASRPVVGGHFALLSLAPGREDKPKKRSRRMRRFIQF
ncbi:Bgt-3378-2 [Blumeria graminis f. sp. tritici]|uniref:Bgt-3378-2 n=2 Tax=Blumeria graminis f. sp. tritici TaxID=62690 RepID=A0A9X9LA88_BLUGR|nr:Bgt-3378-2 [Blumeria graminis f. sp. tritici]